MIKATKHLYIGHAQQNLSAQPDVWTIQPISSMPVARSKRAILDQLAPTTRILQARHDYCIVRFLSDVHDARVRMLNMRRSLATYIQVHGDTLMRDNLTTTTCGVLAHAFRECPIGQGTLDYQLQDAFGPWNEPGYWSHHVHIRDPAAYNWRVYPPFDRNFIEPSLITVSFHEAIRSLEPTITYPYSYTPESLTPEVASMLLESTTTNLMIP